jgi:uncharacterized protein (TIGR03086 family)
MTVVDLGPATRRMADLISAIGAGQLEGPTPCPAYTLGDLLDHLSGLSLAFTVAATKAVGPGGSRAASGDASRLADDWRTRIPEQLAVLAEVWQSPDAWTGTTQAGGIDLPGEVAGVVALDEVVIHGWDVARATGHAYECDQPTLEVVLGFLGQFPDAGPDGRRGPFGPVVEVPAGAPLLDRVVGLAGRDPAWSPA